MMSSNTGRGGRFSDDFHDDGTIGPEEELAFIDEERLPWLEAGDDMDEEGVDTGRIVAFAMLGLLVILALLAVLWWVLRGSSGGPLIADGSVIEAPDEPYKTRPDDPGGAEVAGTGDTSFQVAEGRETEALLAEPAPMPTPEEAEAAPAREEQDVPAAETETAAPAPEPTQLSGVGVQVGAYFTPAAAERGWNTLVGRFEALRGVNHRVVQGIADGSTVYRLQAVAADERSANALCNGLKASGGDCQVKR